MHSKQPNPLPYIAILIAATIGGGVGVFIKLIGLSAVTLTWFRVFVPTAVLFFYLAVSKQLQMPHKAGIVSFASLLNAVRLLLYVIGYTYTSIANAVIILFTWPIWASVFSMWYLRERPSKRTIWLIALSFFGIVIMYINAGVSLSAGDLIGMAAMLASAMLFALSMVIFKEALETNSRPQTLLYQNAVGAILVSPLFFMQQTLPTLNQWVIGIVFGAVMGIVVFSLFFYALKKLPVSHYGVFTYWEVLAGLFFGAAFFNDSITAYTVVGGSLIILSGLLLIKRVQ